MPGPSMLEKVAGQGALELTTPRLVLKLSI